MIYSIKISYKKCLFFYSIFIFNMFLYLNISTCYKITNQVSEPLTLKVNLINNVNNLFNNVYMCAYICVYNNKNYK